MHVLIAVLHRPTKPTGVCRHAANLARCLVDRSAVTQVTLVTGAWQAHYFEAVFGLKSEKLTIVPIKIANRSLSRNGWFLMGLPKLVEQLKPDIVHLSFPLPFLRSRFSCPVVATIHDLYPYECPENFGRIQAIFNRFFFQQCVWNSDGISCVSECTLHQLKHFFPAVVAEKTTAVVYNYVDFKGVQPQPIAHPNTLQQYPFLLTVAQHRQNKNLHLLIQAYAALRQTGQIDPRMQLAIVGSNGPETEQLESLVVTQGLQKQVHFIAAISDRELYWLYQTCALFVIPSSTEGFCLPLVEALSLSCKVVCSDIPIFREVGSDACTYFDLQGDSTQNLARAIEQSWKQPPPVSNSSRFSKAQSAQGYLDFYAELLPKSAALSFDRTI